MPLQSSRISLGLALLFPASFARLGIWGFVFLRPELLISLRFTWAHTPILLGRTTLEVLGAVSKVGFTSQLEPGVHWTNTFGWYKLTWSPHLTEQKFYSVGFVPTSSWNVYLSFHFPQLNLPMGAYRGQHGQAQHDQGSIWFGCRYLVHVIWLHASKSLWLNQALSIDDRLG